ncbi:CMGC/SRPK protein kinase [Nannizzia gypsea CBS 118893]|uniref:EKC/KEOPS complex subunit BUD32 n=1 Tax=Arthroderma gypseum (strain ATCC MYA-4604 / CBS 118893) TaxID=535722 RepID=E4V089_ARTGP|nr:CMGC/SRPK protein kinase [Nannizzia gypsea CBS 118893]EFR03026.1 CMGC/SRPK protein kinase [Nannizzia gypsea CBS 118893]
MVLSRLFKRNLWSLRPNLAQVPRPTSFLPQGHIVDEEACPTYDSKSYYPAKAGDLVANYQVLVKIGWGSRSTVWLARDIRRFRWQSERLIALKINNCNIQQANHERDIEDHINKANPSHRGHVIIRACLESFEVTGPEGKHLCLAYEPMREPVWLYQQRFPDRRLPSSLIKAFLTMILTGLDYLHSECKVVHTDLRLENILVGFEDEHVIEDFAKAQLTLPMEQKIDPTGRIVYRCHNNFGPLKKLMNIPKIVDFGLARHILDPSGVETHPIQPDHYRAPEVILGCGWSFSADIWNIGLLVWGMFELKELFTQVRDSQGNYSAKGHLAEMIALLGPPPKALIAKINSMPPNPWQFPVMGDDGNTHSNPKEFFGGPFFSDKGDFMHNGLIPDRKLEDTVLSLDGKEKELLLSFVSKAVGWLPDERSTARELLEHPFLQVIPKV